MSSITPSSPAPSGELPREVSRRRDLPATAFVLVVWGGLLLAAHAYVSAFASVVPHADDFSIVRQVGSPLPFASEWLWSPHGVHRIPLPRIVMYAMVDSTRDLRAVMQLDVFLLGIAALGSILIARVVRGWTSYSDAVFPLLWLHLGNAFNLLFAFSFTFVLPTVLSCAILFVLTAARQPFGVRSVLTIGGCLLALPLCGGPGVAQAPALALWLGVTGVAYVRSGEPERRRSGLAMLGFALAASLLVGVYAIGLELPEDSAGIDLRRWASTSVKFLTLGFGTLGHALWPYTGLLVIGSVVVAVVLLVRAAVAEPRERARATGLLAYLVALGLMGLAIGLKGRTGSSGFAQRYMTLPAPCFVALYLITCRYARGGGGSFLRYVAFLLLCAPISFHTLLGLQYARMHSARLARLHQDAASGMTPVELVQEHFDALYPEHKESDARRERQTILFNQLQAAYKIDFAPFDADPR